MLFIYCNKTCKDIVNKYFPKQDSNIKLNAVRTPSKISLCNSLSSADFVTVHISIQCSKCQYTMTKCQICWIISLKARRQSNSQLSPIYVYKWKAQFEPYLTEQTMLAWGLIFIWVCLFISNYMLINLISHLNSD